MLGLEKKDIEIIKNILEKYLKNNKVYVFGSRSVGNFKKYSDLDLAIEGEIKNVLSLKNELKESLLPIDVDIVLIDEISIEFLDAIKQDFKEFKII
ncbi:MAG TPA: nucleotidyltransferase domain-containing protein [Rickettsiales bacterium]|nr:nucleotidyltransferase domain-containing protein [Rickettsiales bacterium]